ncbi:MAG: TIGR03032 family protein [Hyphomonadaceae bacterium]|nr:TIGR03032 family protein [Hyphomonadaceae bacterium]
MTQPSLTLSPSRLFTQWLADHGTSLAFTTYQAGKLFFVGLNEQGDLSAFERTFERAMGLAREGDTLWLATKYQLWRFENFLAPGQMQNGYDALFVPLEGRTTGDVDIHDVAIASDGRPRFVVTRFNTIAEIEEHGSFRPVWRPPFIDRLAAEDRCHLNGMAMENGMPRYATAVAPTNLVEAWRDRRADGGIIIDIPSGEIVASGLSMPHSPRLHNGELYVLNAGTGEFGHVNRDTGRFESIAFCRGFLRGLALVGNYAVVGASLPRNASAFEGLALQDRLEKEGVGAKCGLSVVNLTTGDVEHTLHIEGVVEELYDVLALEGLRRPMALGFRSREIHHALKLRAER